MPQLTPPLLLVLCNCCSRHRCNQCSFSNEDQKTRPSVAVNLNIQFVSIPMSLWSKENSLLQVTYYFFEVCDAPYLHVPDPHNVPANLNLLFLCRTVFQDVADLYWCFARKLQTKWTFSKLFGLNATVWVLEMYPQRP